MFKNPGFVEEKAELVAFASLPGIRHRHIRDALTLFGSPAGAWEAVRGGFWSRHAHGGEGPEWRDLARRLEPAAHLQALVCGGTMALAVGEAGYPELLREIHDPPWIIFCRGNVPPPGAPCVAVVGSRKATPYGLEAAHSLARDLAINGVWVVSGAAYGVDASAHRGALQAKGLTAAVLGCGTDVVYPRPNANLLREIESAGCLLSEYPQGTQPLKHHFPARNRIIAGMSLATLVVEASMTSGALLTAEFAMSEGRDVCAVPGPISSSNSKGTNRLIKNGAALVSTVDDILDELGIERRVDPAAPRLPIDPGGPESALLKALEGGATGIEDLTGRVGMTVREALSRLSGLEVSGLVRRAPGGRYYLAAAALPPVRPGRDDAQGR